MKTDRHGRQIALVLGAVAVLVSGSVALGARPIARDAIAVSRTAEILTIERASNGKLLAVGRLDSLSAVNFAASVLGQDFVLIAGVANNRFIQGAEIGRAVALFGENVEGVYLVDAAIVLDGQYVQGVSKVYLQGRIASLNRGIGKVTIGALELDASSLMYEPSTASLTSGSAAGFVGTQPSIAGMILVEQVVRIRGTRASRLDASVGTGRPDASVGTGSPDASVGTGSPD
ncbi:MAG: hypothetical protein WD929_02265, partial [Steroidobacteraceae bacterium]